MTTYDMLVRIILSHLAESRITQPSV